LSFRFSSNRDRAKNRFRAINHPYNSNCCPW
jgi:hypothetical protein